LGTHTRGEGMQHGGARTHQVHVDDHDGVRDVASSSRSRGDEHVHAREEQHGASAHSSQHVASSSPEPTPVTDNSADADVRAHAQSEAYAETQTAAVQGARTGDLHTAPDAAESSVRGRDGTAAAAAVTTTAVAGGGAAVRPKTSSNACEGLKASAAGQRPKTSANAAAVGAKAEAGAKQSKEPQTSGKEAVVKSGGSVAKKAGKMGGSYGKLLATLQEECRCCVPVGKEVRLFRMCLKRMCGGTCARYTHIRRYVCIHV